MFSINLLAKPGLQGEVAIPEGAVTSARELKVVSRLEARIPAAEKTDEILPAVKRRFGWLWLILIVIVVAAAVWWFQGWRLVEDLLLPMREQALVRDQEVVELHPGQTSVSVMTSFLNELPAEAIVDYVDAEVGMLVYRLWGDNLDQDLLRLTTTLEGHRVSDLLPPADTTDAGFWMGTVVFTSPDQEGAVRPLKEEYERFFLNLQDLVSETGGEVVQMIPGTMSTGEYILSGSRDEIQAHLGAINHVSVNVHYHRLSLLNQPDAPGGDYLLHVVFNIIEGPVSSPLSSFQGSTGA